MTLILHDRAQRLATRLPVLTIAFAPLSSFASTVDTQTYLGTAYAEAKWSQSMQAFTPTNAVAK